MEVASKSSPGSYGPGCHGACSESSFLVLTQTPGRIQKVDPSIPDSNTPIVRGVQNLQVNLLFGSPRGLGIAFLAMLGQSREPGSVPTPPDVPLFLKALGPSFDSIWGILKW